MKLPPFHVFGFPVQLSKVILIDSLFSLCFPAKSITPINFYTSPNNKYLEQCKDEYADENETSEASTEAAATANVLPMNR